MANPFLVDEDLENINEEAMNPFLTHDNLVPDDNPFGENTSNPFAFGDEMVNQTEQQNSEEFDVVMSFFGTTIETEDDSVSTKSITEDNDELKKVPPNTPLPPKTQKLINTVSNKMDETSSDLLRRIPVTRPPSPISIRDLQSPSPTQDNCLVDLLNMSDGNSSLNTEEELCDNLLEPTNENLFNKSANDSEIAGNKSVNVSKQQPPRPPPPRNAPPRPAPPGVVSSTLPQRPQPIPHTVVPDTHSDDLFDVFGTSKPPKPPPPKTKEDILSLFDKPMQAVTKPDLLSDDIVLDSTKIEVESLTNNIEYKSEEAIFNAIKICPDESTQNITYEPPSANKCSNETTIKVHEMNNKARVPTPDIEITTVEDLPRSDDEEELQLNEKENTEIKDIQTSNASSFITESESKSSFGEENINLKGNGEKVKQSSPLEELTQQITSDRTLEELSDISIKEDYGKNNEKVPMPVDLAQPIEVDLANPFTNSDDVGESYPSSNVDTNIFTINDKPNEKIFGNAFSESSETVRNSYGVNRIEVESASNHTLKQGNQFENADEFDAFTAKFESAKRDNVGILSSFAGLGVVTPLYDAWGNQAIDFPNTYADGTEGFGCEDDDFHCMNAPESKDFADSINARPVTEGAIVVTPRLSSAQSNQINGANEYNSNVNTVLNPFEDKTLQTSQSDIEPSLKRTDSQETPQTPLFDEDVSQPLEEFPRLNYEGPGWEMQLRQPNKKKITGQRFWKKIFVRLVLQNDIPVVQLFNQISDKQPFQELPLQPSYSVSEIGAQQYDQFGKIFTIKLQYIFYKERPGVRPGQVTKAERITNKLTKFAQYAIAGDYEGVKEFGSDLRKLGLPVEHAPQSSQLFKIGSMNYEDMKQFSVCIEEALFHIPALRERALTYKMEEVQVTAVDEIVVEQDTEGRILKQIARVRLFFLAFLTGMPTIELGVNDMWRQGKEVVGRHDIIPVATEEWIRLEAVEFHSIVNQKEYENSRLIRFQPPDANYIELLRFRVRPPKNRELPLQLKATWVVTGNKVELRADILVPGFTSRKHGQIPCEDVSIRFPIPECWIYLFRVEKHFRYGSVKSAHRRTGKIKGIERILGAVDTLQESLIEVTSGQAKYEHHHRAIVWRCPRLPKEGQGAYTTHQLVCRMALTSYDQIPNELAPYAFVEFTMPATQVSHTTVRSVSVQNSESDEPPEKYVRYLARHEYKVGIETTHGETTNPYLAATRPIHEEPIDKSVASPVPPSDSDSDSN